jgi:glycosyltransferase involved in cell wall biosynthesis
VYNEAEILDDTIGILLRDVASLPDVLRDVELIVVDDGSTDGSAAIAAQWAEREPRVKLVRHRWNAGVGAAIATGLAHATKDWFCVNCADRPFDTRDIARLRPLFETADLVVVSRTDRSANSPYRKLTSRVNYLLIRLLFRIPVADCQFVQFYRTAWLKDVEIISRGTLVPPELILRMVRKGARIAQARLPFHARPGGMAKCGHPKHAIRALEEMARLRLRLWREALGGAGPAHPARGKAEGPR